MRHVSRPWVADVAHPNPNISTAFLYRFDPHVRYHWLSNNPTIIACVVSFSSPIALCVCLLLMLSPSERRLLRSRVLQASGGVEGGAGLINKRLKIDLGSEQEEQEL